MCGIAGVYDEAGADVGGAQLAKMGRLLAHRGPDDEGYCWIDRGTGAVTLRSGDETAEALRGRAHVLSGPPGHDAGIALVHRRYSIVDLTESGHQPFVTDRVVLAFNGEIYNYRALRDELAGLGHRFTTRTDTEVFARGYEEWGTGVFARMVGVWAGALFDREARGLILFRDRVGKRPLYWRRVGRQIVFASEIKALVGPDGSGPAPDPDAAQEYALHARRDVEGSTCFQGVRSLPSGCWVAVGPPFPDTAQRYWSLPRARMRARELSAEEAARWIGVVLRQAVRDRIPTDVPWCVELSGGLDSSCLVALSSQHTQRPVTTYTVEFDDPEANETPFARMVGERFGCEMRMLKPELRGLWRDLAPFVWLQEEPWHSPVLVVNQKLRVQMREAGIRVLLNGAAGDELFAGYPRYFPTAQTELLRTGRLRTFLGNGLRWSERTGSRWQSLTSPVRRELGMQRRGSSLGRLSDMLRADFEQELIPYWLRSGDKAMLGIPIEPRNPFLDHRVVEVAFQLPLGLLVRDGWHKWALRKAMEDLLPPGVVWRENKAGFPFPYARFARESAGEFAQIARATADLPFEAPMEGPAPHWRSVSSRLWWALFANGNTGLLDALGGPPRIPQTSLPHAQVTYAGWRAAAAESAATPG